MKLPQAVRSALTALKDGCRLMSHRDLDGAKVFKLHWAEGPMEEVQAATMACLEDHGLVHSNMKFPAATYCLSERGKSWAGRQEPE